MNKELLKQLIKLLMYEYDVSTYALIQCVKLRLYFKKYLKLFLYKLKRYLYIEDYKIRYSVNRDSMRKEKFINIYCKPTLLFINKIGKIGLYRHLSYMIKNILYNIEFYVFSIASANTYIMNEIRIDYARNKYRIYQSKLDVNKIVSQIKSLIHKLFAIVLEFIF